MSNTTIKATKLELATEELASDEEMIERERLISRIQARMATSPTEEEKAFWQKLKAALRKSRSGNSEQGDWHHLPAQGLAAAYGNDEPEYTAEMIREPNPDDKSSDEQQPASPKSMERQRQLLAHLQAIWNRPMTDEEAEFWRRFDQEFDRADRLVIELPSDITESLTQEAGKRGMTPEQLAVETLRSTFTSAEDQPQETLLDLLADYTGIVDGPAEPLSEDCGRAFRDGLEADYRRSHQPEASAEAPPSPIRRESD